MRKHQFRHAAVALFISLLCSGLAFAQEPVGVVTALQGNAQLTRTALAAPAALQFKDGLFIRDIVDTQEKSLARILFGGKSTVTVKELSRLEVREEILPTGATRSVHELSSGGILVNAARQLLRPGDEVQIRTPNAVAAVRGTILIGVYNPALAQSLFIVIAGEALITPVGKAPFSLAANTQVTITGTQAIGIQDGPVQTISPARATQLVEEYQIGPAVKREANQSQIALAQLQTATQLATAVVEAITGAPPTITTTTETQALAQATATQIQAAESPTTALGTPTTPGAEQTVTTAPVASDVSAVMSPQAVEVMVIVRFSR